jgi:hypothetical protein
VHGILEVYRVLLPQFADQKITENLTVTLRSDFRQMRPSPQVHLKVSQVNAPLGSATRDGSRQLLVTLLPSPCPARVDLRGTDVLSTRSIWTFSYDDSQTDRTIEIKLSERISSRDSIDLAIVRLPLAWFPPNTVVRDSFPMKPLSHGFETVVIFLKVHRDENESELFSAPLATILPRLNQSFDQFTLSRMPTSSPSLVFERVDQYELTISEPVILGLEVAAVEGLEQPLGNSPEPESQNGSDQLTGENDLEQSAGNSPIPEGDSESVQVPGEAPLAADNDSVNPESDGERLTLERGELPPDNDDDLDEPDDIPHFREPVGPPVELTEEESADDALFVPPIEEPADPLLYPPPPSGNAVRVHSLDLAAQTVLDSFSFFPTREQTKTCYVPPPFLPISVDHPERVDGSA